MGRSATTNHAGDGTRRLCEAERGMRPGQCAGAMATASGVASAPRAPAVAASVCRDRALGALTQPRSPLVVVPVV